MLKVSHPLCELCIYCILSSRLTSLFIDFWLPFMFQGDESFVMVCTFLWALKKKALDNFFLFFASLPLDTIFNTKVILYTYFCVLLFLLTLYH